MTNYKKIQERNTNKPTLIMPKSVNFICNENKDIKAANLQFSVTF